ncbi:MAG: UDP-2,3-diacylglucosamine hydrolase [Bacteroidetes bacterium SW_11_45_7]|nr:MAG: UDP-2,3-diacylglucosamine hydrolase [Bacteroidetes bacterium SW_11_45_7]
MTKGTKIYFASDFHLGIPDWQSSRKREQKIVRWLEWIRNDAEELFLAGDVFDFWFEYRHAVPKGFVRLLGKIAELRDSGIPVHFFTGNHDLWTFGYLQDELGVDVHHHPLRTALKGKQFLIGHGDGLGPKDKGYKLLKKVFANDACQRAFRLLHPDIGINIANKWSLKSRYAEEGVIDDFRGEEDEWLIQYCRYKLGHDDIDYFIFGHRHIPIDYRLNPNSRYINLGDWINYYSYAVFDGQQLAIQFFQDR